MKKLLIILTMLHCTGLYGQKMSFYSGINSTFFYNFDPGLGHFHSSYQPGIGYTLGFQLDSLSTYWWNIPFRFQFERYSASLQAGDGGLGGGYEVEASAHKSVISLIILPLRINFEQRLHFDFGLQLSWLWSEKILGSYSYWILGQNNRTGDLAERYPRYSRTLYAGVNANISYDLLRSKSLVITPVYGYYWGFTNEFREFPQTTKRMQFFLGLQLRHN